MAEAVLKGETTMDTLKEKSKNFDYYREAYGAVLDGMVGVFKAEIPVSEAPPEYVSEIRIRTLAPSGSQNTA